MKFEEFWEIIKTKSPIRLIFFCAGNICRSPYTEMKFEQLVSRSAKIPAEKFIVSSMGFVDQKIPIHELTKRVLLDEGVSEERIARFHSRSSRKYKEEVEKADILIVMDKSNRDIMMQAKFKPKTILLSETVGLGEIDIKDPVLITDYQEYKGIIIQLTKLLQKIVEKIESL